MTMEEYLEMRNEGKIIQEIQSSKLLSEITTYTFELGYQCYLKEITLNEAIETIQNLEL